MKKYILVFIMINISIFIYCQQEWAPIGAEWYFDQQEMLPFQAHGYLHYKVLKDTIINSQLAKLIRKQKIRFDGFHLETDTLYAYEENSKVYYYVNGKFLMFYIFNAHIGDTIKYQPEVFNCDSVTPVIVKSIDTVNMNGVIAKRLTVAYKSLKAGYNHEEIQLGYNEKLTIDYIYPSCGHTNGLNGDQFVYNYLRCYHDSFLNFVDNNWKREYPNAPCDTLINDHVNIYELNDNDNFKIYPNPSNNFINIYSKEAISKIVVYDIQGHKLLENSGNNILKVDISNLLNGIYLLRIITKSGNNFNSKIFKSK